MGTEPVPVGSAEEPPQRPSSPRPGAGGVCTNPPSTLTGRRPQGPYPSCTSRGPPVLEQPPGRGARGAGARWGGSVGRPPPRGVRQPPRATKGPARSGRRRAFSSPSLGGTTYTCWRGVALDAVNLGALKQTDKQVERTPGH